MELAEAHHAGKLSQADAHLLTILTPSLSSSSTNACTVRGALQHQGTFTRCVDGMPVGSQPRLKAVNHLIPSIHDPLSER
jgi:hypothetical protein